MKKLSDTPRNIYFREMYAWRKSHHICVKCGQETAARGRTRCITCLEKDRERSRQRHNALKSEYCTEERYSASQRAKKLYDLRIAFGVCTTCGKHNAAAGHTCCSECILKHRKRAEAKRRKEGIYPRDSYSNMCIRCCKNPPLGGKSLCKECYEKNLQQLSKLNVEVNRQKHIWRNKNRITFNRYETEVRE